MGFLRQLVLKLVRYGIEFRSLALDRCIELFEGIRVIYLHLFYLSLLFHPQVNPNQAVLLRFSEAFSATD